MKPCPRCRYANPDDSLSCNLCGEVFPRMPETVLVPPKPAGADRPKPTAMPSPGIRPPASPAPARPAGVEVGYFLVCPPLAPVKLAPGPEFIVGREHTSHLQLAAPFVSRRHTAVRWNGTHYVARDLGSANGTLVNDAPITEHVLSPGDRITIGTFHIDFVAATAEEARRLMGRRDEGATMVMGADRKEPGAWSGSLAELNLANILQVLEGDRKSGVLAVEADRAAGRLYLLEGRLVHAEFGEKAGEEAVYPMLSLRDGTFRFLPAHPHVERTIETSLQGLLLEATRRADEAGHGTS